MRHRLILDGVEHQGSEELLLGPDKRLAVGIEIDGGIQGWFVERLPGERSYRTIERIPQETVAAILRVVHQAS